MRIEILHTVGERRDAERIRHAVALEIGPELDTIAVVLREVPKHYLQDTDTPNSQAK
jgi:hypothetical protein